MPVKQDALRQVVEPRENRGPGGGQCRQRFKGGVREACVDAFGQVQWDGAEQTKAGVKQYGN